METGRVGAAAVAEGSRGAFVDLVPRPLPRRHHPDIDRLRVVRELVRVRMTTRRRAESDARWIAAIVEARGAGASLREIAGAAGISHVRILQILRASCGVKGGSPPK